MVTDVLELVALLLIVAAAAVFAFQVAGIVAALGTGGVLLLGVSALIEYRGRAK
jgi:hypothetical protein